MNQINSTLERSDSSPKQTLRSDCQRFITPYTLAIATLLAGCGGNVAAQSISEIATDGAVNQPDAGISVDAAISIDAAQLDASDAADSTDSADSNLDAVNCDILSDLSVGPQTFNPSLGQTANINFNVVQESQVFLKIYDSFQNIVRSIYVPVQGDGGFGAGAYDVIWDGKDDASYIVKAGTYTIKVTATTPDCTDFVSSFVKVAY